MRWPWQRKPEQRSSAGDLTDQILRFAAADIAATSIDTASTAAVEAVAGLISRALASAKVETESMMVRDAISGDFLSLAGRDLVRRGQSLHAIRFGMDGGLMLTPCSDWTWTAGDYDPASWRVQASAYGPTGADTWELPLSACVFLTWGRRAERPYIGSGPLQFASTSARLGLEAEKSLADESGGPVAQLLTVPQDGGDGGTDDPLRLLKADISKARGKALLVETTAAAYGEGRDAAPRRDWQPSRLGPSPTDGMVELASDAFKRTISALGASPALFDASDGTAKRESLRQFHLGTVRPLAGLIEAELSRKLETSVRLRFDSYPLDMVSRAQVVEKLTRAGIDPAVAMTAVSLDDAA